MYLLSSRAKCLLCPKSVSMPIEVTFSIGEEFAALVKHSKSKGHRKEYTKLASKDHKKADQEQLSQCFL